MTLNASPGLPRSEVGYWRFLRCTRVLLKARAPPTMSSASPAPNSVSAQVPGVVRPWTPPPPDVVVVVVMEWFPLPVEAVVADQ